MTSLKNLHWCVYILFLFSCARQSSPTGGPKDTIPPVLIKVAPPNEAINFNADELELIFSENVILNSPKEQLIVTPTIGKDYNITYRKNSVVLKFEDPLADSTTYTFNFREAIQDINEKNPVRNLQLAYSTGDYIDSLSIEGIAYDLLKGKPIKDATVALHVENDTFNILEHPAIYFTKTDEGGKYKISHLKPANYFLYAIEDKNRNLIVNSRSESYGFIREHQYLIKNIENASVGLVRLDAGPLKITSARPYNTYYNIRMTKNLRTFTITASDSTDLSYTFGENQANIRVYDNIQKDSIQIHLLALDSIDNAIDTTLYAKFLQREVTPEQFNLSVTTSSLLTHRGEFKSILQFTKPIQKINYDSIYYQIDSLTRVAFGPEDITWDPLQRKLTITKQIDPSFFSQGEAKRQSMRGAIAPKTNPDEQSPPTAPLINEINLRKAAFISIEGDSSKQIVQITKPSKEADLAVISLEIKTAEESYFVELLDDRYNTVQQQKNRSKVRFEDVIPGQYQIRLIVDRNKNGRWDPGNYFNKVEPEPVVYYRSPEGSTIIKGVNANWHIGEGEMFITY